MLLKKVGDFKELLAELESTLSECRNKVEKLEKENKRL